MSVGDYGWEPHDRHGGPDKPVTGPKLEAVHEELEGGRPSLGRWLFRLASLLLVTMAALQVLDAAGLLAFHFGNWRPLLYIFILWGVAIGVSQVLTRGEAGQQTLFLLPALLFTAAMVIFPTFFGLYVAFTDWNLDALIRPPFQRP